MNRCKDESFRQNRPLATEDLIPDLILVSDSPYQHELLACLHLLFESASPDTDESHRSRESAEELVRRLSTSRAEALAGRYPQHLVIGSDQIAILDGDTLGKPHTPRHAIQRLRDVSGKSATFLTELALLSSISRRTQVTCILFTMHFRHLDESHIRRYVEAERPLGYTGNFEAGSLGVGLPRVAEGEDVTSLVSLPLIRLVDVLLEKGVEVP